MMRFLLCTAILLSTADAHAGTCRGLGLYGGLATYQAAHCPPPFRLDRERLAIVRGTQCLMQHYALPNIPTWDLGDADGRSIVVGGRQIDCGRAEHNGMPEARHD